MLALENAVGLLEPPNNLDALWVWTKFLWSFGVLKTWDADACLDRILFWFRQSRIASAELHKSHFWQLRRRRKLSRARADATANVLTLLGYVYNNLDNWADLDKFEQRRGKGNQHERPSL
jgi:hypothetical protein